MTDEALFEPINAVVADGSAASVCVAFSGGIDSTALLHATHRVVSAKPGAALRAVHVHHGLHAGADEWAAHCIRICAKLKIPLHVERVDLSGLGGGPEAAAREARYGRIAEMLAPGEYCAAAHHADDQLETVLLQLFRGAGPNGLAAMPALRSLGKGYLWRPWLAIERRLLSRYVSDHRLEFVGDPSNEDHGVDRSYLRQRILPMVRERWPSVATTVGRSASLCAEAGSVLREVARDDYEACSSDGYLIRSRLRALGAARCAAALRYAISSAVLPLPDRRQLENAMRVLMTEKPDRHPVADWPGGELRAYRDRIYVLDRNLERTGGVGTLKPDSEMALGGLSGTLSARRDLGAGLLVEQPGINYEIRYRSGEERIRPSGQKYRKSIRKISQQLEIPLFLRDAMPLIYAGDELVALGDLVVADGWTTAEGERGLKLEWRPATIA